MRNLQDVRLLARDSTLIILLVGIPMAVFANSISDALSAEPIGWLYVITSGLATIALILARYCLHLQHRLRASPDTTTCATNSIDVRIPERRYTLGDVLPLVQSEVAFLGIIAKRSVSDDLFRRAIEGRQGRPLLMKMILLDPESPAFTARALEEGEDATAWRADLEATKGRLRAYRSLLGVDVELRLTSSYPIWRAIIADNNAVYVSTFLPRQRGTESTQYVMQRPAVDLAYGWQRYFSLLWADAKRVDLD